MNEINPVKQARVALGLTQEQMGQRLGVKQPSIARMENGTTPINERTRLALRTLLAEESGGANGSGSGTNGTRPFTEQED